MGRSAGSRAKKRQQMHAEAKSLASHTPLPNGQTSSAAPEATSEEAQPNVPNDKRTEEPFYEPLDSLPDDGDSLSALLREANAAVSTGGGRLADPRRALHVIRHCTPRLPPAQLAERLPVWCQFLTALLRAPRQQWCREAACRTAAGLLAEEPRLEEAHRLLAGGPLTQLVTALTDTPPENASLASLHCLRAALTHFGRGCGPMRAQVTRLLLQLYDDSSRPGVAWAACRCLALLPRAGAAGGGGASHSAAWSGQMRGLLRSAHSHLDRLLDGTVEVRAFEVPEEVSEHELEPPPLPEASAAGEDPIRLRYWLARRVSAACRVAALMLCSGTRQPVTVPVTALMELTERCVAAGAAPASAAMELQAARRALWDVRAAALRMLETLIVCCGADLVQRATALNRLLLSALQPPADSPSSPRVSPAAEAARRQALRAARAWLVTAGAACGLHTEAERLVTALSEDVRPPQPAKVTLQTNPAATNGVSSSTGSAKKRRRAAADWLETDVSVRDAAPPACRAGRCGAALDVLTQLVTASGPLLPVSAHRALQQLCVGLVLEVQQAAGGPPPPYERASCRAALYRLLRALVADPHPNWPAPVQLAIGLFAAGAQDDDMTVSMLCRDGQALCSRVVQPTHPTLFFPADLSAYSKPPAASADSVDGTTGAGAGADTGTAPADGGGGSMAAPPIPPGLFTMPDYLRASQMPTGTETTRDISSDVSECGSSDSVRLGSRLGSVTAAAAAAAAGAGDDSRAATPPTPSAPGSSRPSPRPSPGGSGGGGVSPHERKHPIPAPTPASGAAGANVTTVTIASSESSGSADGRRSVELAEMEEEDEDHQSIVLGGSEDGDGEDSSTRASSRRPAQDDEDEVEILETKRPRRETMNDDDLAPDVADMLRDFVNEDPEVE